jgi:methylated-DNA-[protein]-cysteine S-methyltransferase
MRNERVRCVELFARSRRQVDANAPVCRRARGQIERYFEDPRYRPILLLDVEGTAFQKKVWQELRRIPVGDTRCYGELAARLNTSARAVGNACRANPLPLLIPCHRVVAAADLGGFGGARGGRRVEVKKWLLRHEAAL